MYAIIPKHNEDGVKAIFKNRTHIVSRLSDNYMILIVPGDISDKEKTMLLLLTDGKVRVRSQ